LLFFVPLLRHLMPEEKNIPAFMPAVLRLQSATFNEAVRPSNDHTL